MLVMLIFQVILIQEQLSKNRILIDIDGKGRLIFYLLLSIFVFCSVIFVSFRYF